MNRIQRIGTLRVRVFSQSATQACLDAIAGAAILCALMRKPDCQMGAMNDVLGLPKNWESASFSLGFYCKMDGLFTGLRDYFVRLA